MIIIKCQHIYNLGVDLALAHCRYQQQAGWTSQLRRHIFARAGLPNARRILEVGCGTGAVLSTITASGAQLFGVDIDRAALHLAKREAPAAKLAAADAHRLPFSTASMDIVLFHFVLLWLHQPAVALEEAVRVTRRGGAIIAFAEPDHTQRTDAPAELRELGTLQTQALRAQGADPSIGRRLPQLFAAAGILKESGMLASPPTAASPDDLELEVLRADLAPRMDAQSLDALLATDHASRSAGTRTLHVPTYYAWGRAN
jgi:ubiquinone/menaquinone biosynthesis C-methylase UbiE